MSIVFLLEQDLRRKVHLNVHNSYTPPQVEEPPVEDSTNFDYSKLGQYLGLEKEELIEKMNEIYSKFWNPLYNFFIPSMKLVSKEKQEPSGRKNMMFQKLHIKEY